MSCKFNNNCEAYQKRGMYKGGILKEYFDSLYCDNKYIDHISFCPLARVYSEFSSTKKPSNLEACLENK